ncbi:MAG: SirB2 family protein [Halioglobus sp.]
MTGFETLKTLHVTCAFLSFMGFALRGYWMLTNKPWIKHRLTRILPHTVDAVLLASAVAMLYLWQLSPTTAPWLMAKILALLVYIALGMIALRFGKTKTVRASAYTSALLTICYIVSVAFTKSPWGVFDLI